jgi:hypothetical protein
VAGGSAGGKAQRCKKGKKGEARQHLKRKRCKKRKPRR